MDENLAYIKAHFLSSNAIIARSNISADVLAELVTHRVLPRAAYFRGKAEKLCSTLGSTGIVLDDDYFHPTAITQARHGAALLAVGVKPLAVAETVKSNFVSGYTEHLTELMQFELVEDTVWQERLAEPESRLRLAESEYDHWIAGTYALCTRDNTPQAVAAKECMVQSVDALTSGGMRDDLTEAEFARLSRYLQLYDKVAALFAPFERPASSGQRLRVTIANKYGIEI